MEERPISILREDHLPAAHLKKMGTGSKLFVMREDSNDGVLELKLEASKGSNVMIDELIFVEQLQVMLN